DHEHLSKSHSHYRHLHSFPTRRSSDLALFMKKKGIHDSKSLREHYFSKGYKSKIFDNFRHSLIVFMESSTISATYGLSLIENFQDRKSTRLNSSHVTISYAVFCLKKKT